jgi:TrmH family RNA methyltransferase
LVYKYVIHLWFILQNSRYANPRWFIFQAQDNKMMREITSTSNPIVKKLRSLATSKKARQESASFIIEGRRGIETLLAHESRHYQLETLVIASHTPDVEHLTKALDTIVLPDFVFEKVSDVQNSQGLLGIVRHTPAPFEFFPDSGRYLILDSIRDPGNLGTLIRSAVGAEFDGVLLFGDCVEPFNPKVIRSTMGTFAHCGIWTICREDIERMIDTGYELCVTTGHDGDSLYESPFGRKTALVIGSEAQGVSGELMVQASRKITIPLANECESLNAAMAGSICMFHIRHGAEINKH